MQTSFFKHPTMQITKQKLKLTAARLVNHHVNLAVTGLSGSGKTAFITSLVNQLIEANEAAQLPFFSVVRESRLIGVKRDVQPNLTFSRFAYEDAMAKLTQTSSQWPSSTKGISQVRLKIKYKKSRGLSKYLTEEATLTLDITDYPGEWLLDLPLLDMDYAQWSRHCEEELSDPKRNALAKPFFAALADLDLNAKGDELALQNIAELYTQYLVDCQSHGYQLLQPGRFILPGELSGAPVLHFFPVTGTQLEQQEVDLNNPAKDSNAELLRQRFKHYKTQVVQPFYKEHFKRFDRQVVLVDCLSALNRGFHSYQDLQKALDWLMGSFQYGSSNILNRLFQPKIDKLVFAASKADHITPDQQTNLVKLLESMLHSARKQIQFDGVITESTAISAIRSSKSGLGQLNGESIPVLQGRNEQGSAITLFPGEVPQSCPGPEFWKQQQFEFPKLSPPILNAEHVLPHIRMDQVLDFLLADKLE
ncbi:YcjX family GTP-binding protein [Paraglaciecola arctica]|uniref:Predicted ATPase n=1 Tax=Paraglaciecola arctica BSs20135 TaxID=493475 RepID=K6Y4F2_9ALTE|nr:YcjX family protein [Paraglaciecola arctica]GAC18796.1 predicted ATPase [Paraglaciecola arctica BSs20135]